MIPTGQIVMITDGLDSCRLWLCRDYTVVMDLFDRLVNHRVTNLEKVVPLRL